MSGDRAGGYEPPSTTRGRPAVITWFRVYAVTTLLLYVGVVAFVVLWPMFVSHPPPRSSGVLIAVGVFTLAFAAFYAIAAMVPYRPWGWTLGLVAICLGLSGGTMLAAIPLLVFWLKPETKAAFGRL